VESHTSKRTAPVVILVGLFLAAVVGGVIYKTSSTVPIDKLVRSDLPMLELNLKFTDLNGDPVTPEHSQLLFATKEGQSQVEPKLPDGCSPLIGGDTADAREISADDHTLDRKCPKVATWYVVRHPIGFTLYFEDAKKLFDAFAAEGPIKTLFQSRFFQGLFHDPLHAATIQAEDLNLQGLKGTVIKELVKEAVIAHGKLHYDVSHGREGFVFSFVRAESPLAGKILPLMAGGLARSGYRLPTLSSPIFEMRIGLQRVFFTEFHDRAYFANGLEALLNVLESLGPKDPKLPSTPLVLTARAEAFVDNLLTVMVDKPALHLSFGFGLPPENSGALQFEGGRLTQKLTPRIFKGVLAGIPHDVFGALVTSYQLPPEMTIEDWQTLVEKGPQPEAKAPTLSESGVAIIWDMGADGGTISQMGVVIAKQTTPKVTEPFKHYFSNQDLTTECGGGTVFLAATAPTLLTRMKESCHGQSLSVLNWQRGDQANALLSSQFLMFMNPGVGMRELFLAGGAGTGNDNTDDSGSSGQEPQWKKQYRLAKEQMRKDAEKVFQTLPIFAYRGNAVKGVGLVELQGLTVQQGASR
jgi:hypothetical protein